MPDGAGRGRGGKKNSEQINQKTLTESERTFRILTEIATSAIFIYQGEKLVYVK